MSFIIKVFKLGAGYTWPGHVVLRYYPNVFRDYLSRYNTRLVLISGTNGKTTTAKLLTHILKKSGHSVIANKSGANLLNGLVSALLLEIPVIGSKKFDFAVFETDELTLPKVLEYAEPAVLLLLNLSRDQLDRYGEIDAILDRWAESVSGLSEKTNLVVDSTQEYFSVLSANFPGRVFYFGELSEMPDNINLLGDFNAKNVSAAIVAAGILGISRIASFEYLMGFDAAYGRGEMLESGGKIFYLFLAKNPVSFNKNLDLIVSAKIEYDALLFMLSDDLRDGRDVSWIYDIEPEKLKGVCAGKTVYIGGSRCPDFAVRLHYCGVAVSGESIDSSVRSLVSKIIKNDSTQNILVLPNYSSMLSVREALTGKEIL